MGVAGLAVATALTVRCAQITDFGLSRLAPEENELMTEHVVTRWYRPPELMLCADGNYTAAVDMWSVGCIFAELLGRKPLFPGKNFMHQLCLIFEVIGTPDKEQLAFIKSEQAMTFMRSLNTIKKTPFKALFPYANPKAVDLLERMLVFTPSERITMDEALKHPYFASVAPQYTDPEPELDDSFEFDFEKQKLSKGDLKRLIVKEVQSFKAEVMRKAGGGPRASAGAGGVDASSHARSARRGSADSGGSRGSGAGAGSASARRRSTSRDRGSARGSGTTTSRSSRATSSGYGQRRVRRSDSSRSTSRESKGDGPRARSSSRGSMRSQSASRMGAGEGEPVGNDPSRASRSSRSGSSRGLGISQTARDGVSSRATRARVARRDSNRSVTARGPAKDGPGVPLARGSSHSLHRGASGSSNTAAAAGTGAQGVGEDDVVDLVGAQQPPTRHRRGPSAAWSESGGGSGREQAASGRGLMDSDANGGSRRSPVPAAAPQPPSSSPPHPSAPPSPPPQTSPQRSSPSPAAVGARVAPAWSGVPGGIPSSPSRDGSGAPSPRSPGTPHRHRRVPRTPRTPASPLPVSPVDTDSRTQPPPSPAVAAKAASSAKRLGQDDGAARTTHAPGFVTAAPAPPLPRYARTVRSGAAPTSPARAARAGDGSSGAPAAPAGGAALGGAGQGGGVVGDDVRQRAREASAAATAALAKPESAYQFRSGATVPQPFNFATSARTRSSRSLTGDADRGAAAAAAGGGGGGLTGRSTSRGSLVRTNSSNWQPTAPKPFNFSTSTRSSSRGPRVGSTGPVRVAPTHASAHGVAVAPAVGQPLDYGRQHGSSAGTLGMGTAAAAGGDASAADLRAAGRAVPRRKRTTVPRSPNFSKMSWERRTSSRRGQRHDDGGNVGGAARAGSRQRSRSAARTRNTRVY